MSIAPSRTFGSDDSEVKLVTLARWVGKVLVFLVFAYYMCLLIVIIPQVIIVNLKPIA